MLPQDEAEPQVLAVTQLPPPPRCSGICCGSWRVSPLGTVPSPPGGPLIPTVPVGCCVMPMLAAASAALEMDCREVAPSQDAQGLAEGEGQAVALAGKAWRGSERTKTASMLALDGKAGVS